jgi:hypothetical protein
MTNILLVGSLFPLGRGEFNEGGAFRKFVFLFFEDPARVYVLL